MEAHGNLKRTGHEITTPRVGHKKKKTRTWTEHDQDMTNDSFEMKSKHR